MHEKQMQCHKKLLISFYLFASDYVYLLQFYLKSHMLNRSSDFPYIPFTVPTLVHRLSATLAFSLSMFFFSYRSSPHAWSLHWSDVIAFFSLLTTLVLVSFRRGFSFERSKPLNALQELSLNVLDMCTLQLLLEKSFHILRFHFSFELFFESSLYRTLLCFVGFFCMFGLHCSFARCQLLAECTTSNENRWKVQKERKSYENICIFDIFYFRSLSLIRFF